MAPPELPASPASADDALRRARRLVNLLFTAIIATVIVVSVAILSLRYVEAVNDGRRHTEVLADLLSEYLMLRLRGIDGALSRIAADNRRIGGPDGSEREWTAAMRSAIAGVPGLSSLVILDTDGVVRHATVEQIRGLSWADRHIFQELARGIPNMVVVDPPVTMVAGNQVLIPFGRALTNPRGDFIGAIIALLLPHQLRDFLDTFDLGQTGIAWVLLASGDVLFRDGAVDALGETNVGKSPLFAANGLKGDGFAKGALYPGGAEYVTAYRESAFADLTVAVSVANASFLGRWRSEAIVVGIFVVIAAGLLYVAAGRIKSRTIDVAAASHLDKPLDNSV